MPAREAFALDDTSLVARTAALLVPSAVQSSFLIHAPLELLARGALLPLVPEEHRAAARRRISELGERYTREHAPIERLEGDWPDTASAVKALARGLDERDGPRVDAAARSLVERHPVKHLRQLLWPLVFDRVGLAAHAPMLFAELPRVSDRFDGLGQLLRAPLVGLSREPGTIRTTVPLVGEPPSGDALEARLGTAPHVEVDSDFVAPKLRAVQPLAQTLLSGVDQLPVEVVRRALLRVAARSMLEDDPASAPYGWTHCLTLPLAVLENVDLLADPGPALVVAATHVLAFRATCGRVQLRGDWRAPEPIRERFAPGTSPRANALRQLVVRAALHHDAHLVKYTRACLDAALHAPADELLFFAAAERLGQWWDEHPGAGFD